MQKPRRVYVIQGAGLACPLAALLFVLTWNWLFFLLIPIGAAAGYLASIVLKGRSLAAERSGATPARSAAGSVVSGFSGWFGQMLLHRRLLVRFGSLLAVGFSLFVLAWLVGYTVLPEAALRGSAQAHMARGALDEVSQATSEEWCKIVRANLIPVLLIVLGNVLLRINGIPFGYLVALYNVGLYGLFVGTNSFAIPYAERMAPSLAILGRSGPYEMTALVLLAAASGLWSLFDVKRLFHTIPERVAPAPRVRLADILAIAAGLALMLAANWLEASMILVVAP